MTHILFLRAVNVGGTNKVPMKRLMEAIRGESLGEPSFLLQSGNVIVQNPRVEPTELLRRTEQLISAEFGVSTVAIGRTARQLAEVMAANPFAAPEGGHVHVALWDEAPAQAHLDVLAGEEFAGAQLSLSVGAAYMRYDGGSHGSKLSNALLGRRLKVPTTARNVKTLERLLALEVVRADLG